MFFAISWVIILVTLAAFLLPTKSINDQPNPEMFLIQISDTPSSWRAVFMFSVIGRPKRNNAIW